MKIIFLDVDGVLNSREYDRRRNPLERNYIDETRLPIVKRIVDEAHAEIVISSTWRVHWDRDERKCDEEGKYINEIFGKHGLKIYDKTPDLGYGADRKDEIKEWLDLSEQEIDAFVIIDDYPFGWGELSPYFVKTDPDFRLGLEYDHAEKAVRILTAHSA